MVDFIPADFAETGCHFAPRSTDVARFQVIGERSSGTNFVSRILSMNTTLTASDVLGWKHGTPQMVMIPSNLIVVISVRRADAWARSMFAKPWHTTPQMQQLTFSDFLRSRWDTLADRARYFSAFTSELDVGQPLQLDRDPLTGAPYPNLFALRRGKLRSHLTFLNRDCNLCLVRSEQATADPEAFIRAFREAFGLPPLTDTLRHVQGRLGSRFLTAIDGDRTPPDRLSDADMAFLREQSDLALEARLGYHY